MYSNSRRASGVQLHQRLCANSMRRERLDGMACDEYLLFAGYPLHLLVADVEVGVVAIGGQIDWGKTLCVRWNFTSPHVWASPVYLVHLVSLVDLVHLIDPAGLVQPDKQDKPNEPIKKRDRRDRPNRPNEQDRLVDFLASC